MLLKAGAVTSIKSTKYGTALQLAKEKARKDPEFNRMVTLLTAHGATE